MTPSFFQKGSGVLRVGAVARQLVPVISAGALLLVLLQVVPALAQETAKGAEAYRAFPLIGSRLALSCIHAEVCEGQGIQKH